MAAFVKELECRLETFTADIRKSFLNRERSLSLGRTPSDNDNNSCATEKKPDKTDIFKTQLASVALSALKVKDLNTGILSSSSSSSSTTAVINQQPYSATSEASSKPREKRIPPNRLALAPPPIPRRQSRLYSDRDNLTKLPATRNGKVQSKSLSDADNSKLDCASDLCSISFDDIGDSDDLVIFDKKLDPNQSSSDSSRSQTTIDTGYISAFETDRSSVTTSTTHPRQFRGRFSSEDTQSSLDSYSSDLQRADTVESLQSNFTDSPFILKKNSNIFNFEQTNRFLKKIASSGSIDSDNNANLTTSTATSSNNIKSITTPIKSHAAALRRPNVPARKGIRPPPLPPLRASQLADIMKDAEQCLSTMMNSGKVRSSNDGGSTNKNGNSSKPHQTLTQINHAKINQRQDSNISSDSYSMMSSPGYNSKNMEAPLLWSASKMNKSKNHHKNSTDSFIMSSMNKTYQRGAYPKRQDSSISCESQNSSPGSKLLDAPLLAHAAKMSSYKQCYKPNEDIIKHSDMESSNSNAAIIKSASTPASLQTIVRFSNGSNSHTILSRKTSHPYVTRGKLQFTLCQILLNAIALLIIGGGLAAYFRAYPTIKFINTTISSPMLLDISESMSVNPNPQPGICLPTIVKFCQVHKIPYNYTVFPNYIGHFGQLESQLELEQFDALVDVQCFELVPLYLCSLFVPKCSASGKPVSPCKALCLETMRRCGFFFDVFGLELPEYVHCNLFTDSLDPEECVGGLEMKEWKNRKPLCEEFSCDKNRCIPYKYVCDGVVDCFDQTDELNCAPCNKPAKDTSIHCGEKRCMSDRHICNGNYDCPYGEDERNCIRLSSTNGDLGRGMLEIYKANKKRWEPACIHNWDVKQTPAKLCSLLGYTSVNNSRLVNKGSNVTLHPNLDIRMSQRRMTNIFQDYGNCNDSNRIVNVELTCTKFECGKVRTKRRKMQKRIVGGKESKPGDWPFLAAILGGPEQIFYCAGVLIADQWILTASHCIGNHTLQNLNDWTIQLGMTRRHSHAHYGQKIKVKKVIPHPQYSQYVAHDNDIALFQLATRVAFHDHLLPVCLPPQGMKELEENTECTVIGWGKKQSANSNAQNIAVYETAINEVVVPILNRDTCNEWLGCNGLNVTDGMICAGYQEGKFDACQGDSGGPLLCPLPGEPDRWFVGGIVSWGIMCAQPKLPGVYANVVKYIPWILSQINNHTSTKYESGG